MTEYNQQQKINSQINYDKYSSSINVLLGEY